jgi:phage terminase large subunit-like protein
MSDVAEAVVNVDHWRADPAAFIETVLYDPETGAPFKLLDAEREFLKHSYQTDADGRLLYPEQVYGAPKKSGKTGFAGLHMLTTILLFGGYHAEGFCLANDQEQAQSRVFAAIRNIVGASPLLKREAKITADKITFPNFHGAMIATVASNFATAAGANPVESSFDEMWAYSSERAHRLWDEMIPPPTRKIACRLTVTYAGFSGESVVLEDLYKRGLEQPQVGPDLYAGNGLLMFWSHVPIAPWQTQAWLDSTRRSMRPNQYLRMVENRFVVSEGSFITPDQWDAIVDPDMRPVLGDKTLQIVVGIDASVKHDSTALCAVSFDYNTQRCRLVTHRVFQPSPDDPLDFEGTVEATILEWSRRFQLQACYFDPWQLIAVSQRLAKHGITVEEFPQSVGNLTLASQTLFELIKGRNLTVYPDDAIRLAISRAVAVETSRGWRISKEKASHKIDVVVALAMACHGAMQKQTSYNLYLPGFWE